MRDRSFALWLAAATLCVPAVGWAAPEPRPTPEAARGARLFAELGCASCHGTVGQGGAGPRLAPAPRPLAFIASYLRAPAGDMPPFTEQLVSEADIAALHAYLASIPEPRGGPTRP